MLSEVRNSTSSTRTPIISIRLTDGTKIWPATVSLVRRISIRGSSPSCTACWVMEKAPVITAWLAITVATIVSRSIGQ